MIIVFAVSLSVLAVLIILSPFFFGKGGHLQAAASINSLDKLEAVKDSILKRFIEDERAYDEKRISKMAWEQRRQYLSNRYIDAARRLDYLQNLAKEQAAAKSQGKGSAHG
ncbi:MAG TPA: hypothetical protein VE954_32995 [Oligoflexus sp.]|uniref:hypothetical protein n=1 Tax=Oligoflexus sp. TaxID=1971216 RepID=UPI002D413DDA|nr:hypothetical protein [Oligoflexus sp.]HYX37943.1 hypothetical protein [Oligoflexus sp.]